jgi:hypothetical protein
MLAKSANPLYLQSASVRACVLTRHERARNLYNHRANEPDQKGAGAALATCTDITHTHHITHTVGRIIG